jgi:hypothetical protein
MKVKQKEMSIQSKYTPRSYFKFDKAKGIIIGTKFIIYIKMLDLIK